MNKTHCVCTAVAGNYLAFARVLAASLHQHHPELPFFLLVGDESVSADSLQGLPGRVLGLEDLHLHDLRTMLIRYDRKQVMVASKPALLRHLLESGFESVLYLDADMLVTASLDSLLQSVASHSLTLTPHIGAAFASAERQSMEQSLLYAGMYNGGVVGVANREESRRFLSWWERRLRTHCLDAVSQGIHYDQRWLDLAPAFVADLHLLRDPGVNVAYWNLPDLAVACGPEGLLVNGSPLRLFHFSGFSPALPEQVTRYCQELCLEDFGPVAGMFRSYATLLQDAGWDQTITKSWPWDGWRKFFRRWILSRLAKLK